MKSIAKAKWGVLGVVLALALRPCRFLNPGPIGRGHFD